MTNKLIDDEKFFIEVASRILGGLCAKPGFDATIDTLKMFEDQALDSAASLIAKGHNLYPKIVYQKIVQE